MSQTPTNIYHCCVYKTGSQWLRQVLDHRLVRKSSGMDCYRYEDYLPNNVDPRKITERFFDEPFPENKILTPLFISFPCFQSIPKPANYKAFFVVRDPRDIIVSWYFSALYSHKETQNISRIRNMLESMTLEEGLLHGVRSLNRAGGPFEALKSWSQAFELDNQVALFKFEDLTGSEQRQAITKLLNHCDIEMSDRKINTVLRDLSFKRLSGRKQGAEDAKSHYRKGISGDWVNYFTPQVEAKFMSTTGSLLEQLGYE